MNKIIIGTADFTRELNNYHAKTIVVGEHGEDIYISSLYPFNHMYFDIKTPSQSVITLSVKCWTGSAWESVDDLIDGTYGMSESGFITWSPSDVHGWSSADTSTISELNSYKVYGKYWLKINLDINTDDEIDAWIIDDYETILTAIIREEEEDPSYDPSPEELEAAFDAYKLAAQNDLELNWIGNLFSTDSDLTDEFYALTTADMYSSLGVTSHIKKHIRAAEIIAGELQSRNIAVNPSQVLEREDFRPASVQKVAEMIFNELGDAYRDQKELARNDYYERMKKVKPTIDVNNNAKVERIDTVASTGNLYR